MSVDSETCSLVASSTNWRFTSADGRAVMEGLREVEVFSFTRSVLLVLQNADISLSCNHNKTDSNLGCSNSIVVTDGEQVRWDKQRSPAVEAHIAPRSKPDTADERATS
jgi:hypothetical protein